MRQERRSAELLLCVNSGKMAEQSLEPIDGLRAMSGVERLCVPPAMTAALPGMKLFGLTGGIGMGKSTAGRLLQERGVAVVDTDLLARQVVEPGQAVLTEIQQAFGPEIVGADGFLRRGELARRVFGNPPALKQLEAILHPRIRLLWQAQVAAWRDEGRAIGVVVIPLLFETDAASNFEAVVCVACSATSQARRLQGRGWDAAGIEQRIQVQWPVERKMELANYVVWNEGSVETLGEQLRRIIA